MRDTAIVGHRNFAIEYDLAWSAQPTQNGSRSSSSTTGARLMFKEEFHRPTISIRPTHRGTASPFRRDRSPSEESCANPVMPAIVVPCSGGGLMSRAGGTERSNPSPSRGQHFLRPPFGHSGLAFPRGRFESISLHGRVKPWGGESLEPVPQERARVSRAIHS
jgi:hypothetical protein